MRPPATRLAAAARRYPAWWVALAYVGLALALAAPNLGNPIIHVDDQFYHLVGGRMLQGALPFVDIWDRKPIGLFLLYAGFYAIGGGSVIVYQLAACLCTGLTAFLIFRLARAIAPVQGALCAGAVYPAWLLVFNSAGGQSPVFYNALMALAASCVLKLLRDPLARCTTTLGCGAMLACGLALQIKYSVMFETFLFGVLICLAGSRPPRLAAHASARAVLWALCALLPTLAALLWYEALGHGGAFVQANFISIFRREIMVGASMLRLASEAALLTPFWLAFWLQHKRCFVPADRVAVRFFCAWAAVAIAGFLVVGTYYAHYVAPLLVPLCVLAAPALAPRGRPGPAGWLLLGGGLAIAIGTIPVHWQERGQAAQFDRLARLVAVRKGAGCIYVHEGDPALYDATRSCLPSRFVFPDHLSAGVEALALAADPVAEVERILATHPTVVALTRKPSASPPNLAARRALLAGMADYQVYATARLGRRDYVLYSLRQAPASAPLR